MAGVASAEGFRHTRAQRMGTLYYGDNLDILRRYMADQSIDLVYLGPRSWRRSNAACFNDDPLP